MSLAYILKDTILPYVKTIGNNWWLGFVGYFAPIGPLVLVMVCFIMTDFVTGCLASYKRVTAAGKRWCFYSDAAWRTIYKFGFCTMAVAGLYVIGNDVLGGDFGADRLPNILCAMVCFTELWSFAKTRPISPARSCSCGCGSSPSTKRSAGTRTWPKTWRT